jgi:hypothetical protein
MKSPSSRSLFRLLLPAFLLIIFCRMEASGQALDVMVWTDIQMQHSTAPVDSYSLQYTEGDRFRVSVRATKPCYVRLLYRDAVGTTQQIFPNLKDTTDYIQEDRTYQLPTLFEVQPPFGNEELILFASTEKFTDLRVHTRNDGTLAVDDSASVFLKRLRAMSIFGEYAEEHLRIRTIPKIRYITSDTTGPEIRLMTERGTDYIVTSDSACSVEISIRDSSGIDSLFLDGTPLPVDSHQVTLTTVRQIQLHTGMDTVIVRARDREGNSSSRLLVIQRMESPIGSRWAVVVGVSAYQDSAIPQLKYAHRDAQTFADFLRSSNGGAFNDDHILVILDGHATKKSFTEALFSFLAKTKREDLVMIFFSGHGSSISRDQSYFLLNDTKLSDLENTAVAMKEIQNAVTKRIPAERVIVFSDACFSGNVNVFFIGRRSVENDKNLINRYLHELGRSKPGLLSITSSSEGEISREGWVYWEHGLFTYFLVAGLGGKITDTEGRVMKPVPADANNDGIVTLGEIVDYLKTSVSGMTGGKQNPQISKTTYDRNLPLSVLR